LAPSSQRTSRTDTRGGTADTDDRLFRGPAFKESLRRQSGAANVSEDWPTYRHDAARSGASQSTVKTPLTPKWRVELGGKLTSPVMADGRVFVALPDAYAVQALSAGEGKPIWTFTASGRIDSPPTVDQGRVIFGSADGHVYCLRAEDGALVWRFRAAPRDERLVSFGRLESVWPVHGSVLIHKGIIYCVAGRSTFLDGGLRFCRLDAKTGRLLSERMFDDQQSPQRDVAILNMPTSLTDILSTDGNRIFMRSQAFDLEGQPIEMVDPSMDPMERATQQTGPGAHIFSATGFLDDDAWHRSYWIYGRASSYGCNWWFRSGRYAPAGRLLVRDEDRVYGFGREPGLFVWSHVLENHLFCSAPQASDEAIGQVKEWSKASGRNGIFNRAFTRQAAPDKRFAPEVYWSVQHPPLHVRAMVLANDTLFIAGPPDVLDEDQAYQWPEDPQVKAKAIKQDEALAGKGGAFLLGLSAKKGETQFKVDLPSPPVWDGMAVAAGKLFIADKQGHLTCFAGN
jgi:outer membrane protein assembly factor BamB